MASINVGGIRIAYERAGHGPPLVLLHGYVGDGRSTWQPQLDALADSYTVVAWDAPGAGGSSDPPESFGMAGYADCLAGFISGLGLVDPHVAGLSFGGALAIALFGRHPEIPRTLTLASAYAGWGGSLAPDVAERRLAQALDLADLPPDYLVATLLPTMFSGQVVIGSVEPFVRSIRAFRARGLRALARASAEDLREVLPHIDIPTLLVYGSADERAPRSVAEDLHAAVAGSRLVVLEGVGHVCNLEAPASFNDVLRDFLRTAP